MKHSTTFLWKPARGISSLAFSVVLLLSACGREDPATLLASAREYQAKGDHQAAIIQLKNAIQQKAENGEARLMLGRSALIVGDAPTAEKEFRKALEFGQPASTVIPLIAAAAMMQHEGADKVISEFASRKLDDPKTDAELRALVGEAQLRIGKGRQAGESFTAALARDPECVRAQLGVARLQAVDGKLAEATKSVDAIVAAHPGSVDALQLLGQLKLAQGDRAGARAALKATVEVSPASPAPRLQLISILIEDRQLDSAAAEVAAARAARAPEIALQFFDAQIAWGKKDTVKARELAQQVLKRAPNYVPATVLLGEIEFQDNNYAKAESHLRLAVAQAPKHSLARALLARNYLASGQPVQAMEALRPVIDEGALADPRMLLLVGETYFSNGDLKQAARYFESAAASKSQQPLAQTRLAQIALAGGDLEGGLRRLESIISDENAPLQADIAALTGYVRQGNLDKALEVARGIIKKRPNDPVGFQALGSVLVLKKQFPGAKTAFLQALQLNPTYVPAAAALAQFDLGEKNPKKARERFEAILAKDPKSEAALAGLARVLVQTKAPASEVVAVLQRAVGAAPRSVDARLALIEFHLRSRDAPAALTAAQEASAAIDANTRILDALGRAQLAAGDSNQAIETFNRLAALEPRSPLPLVRLASVYTSRKDNDKAAEALLRAQRVASGNIAIVRELVATYIRMGKPEEALKQAKAIQAALPNSVEGFLLEGEVHGSAKEFTKAELAYREALKVDPNSEPAALRLHAALVASSKKADADAFAGKWLGAHPKAVTFRSYLAEQALRTGDLKTAVSHYGFVVMEQPGNAVALNNLAWAMGQLGDPKALDYAERAVKIAPNSPAALDTLGVLLTSRGHAVRGIEYLSRAVELAPQRPEIRLNYAKALLKAGRRDEARKQLAQLEAVEQDYAGKSEVANLMKQ